MGTLSQKQLDTIEKFLDHQDLKFPPLRAEIFDHLIGDLEQQLANGNTFEQAWGMISNDIPSNHFKQLENETMEAINKRFNISRGLTYLTIALLILTSAFKLLHLPGTTMLLFASLGSMALAFFISSISGVRMYKEKKGAALLMTTVFAVLYFFLGWTFKLLQMPGATFMQITSVSILLVLFTVIGVKFSTLKDSESNILTYLHLKHTPGIERFFLIFMILETILKVAAISFGYHPNVSGVLLIMVLSAGLMQFFALNWHPSDLNTKIWYQILIFATLFCAMIPAILSIPFEVRVPIIAGFYLLAGVVVNVRDRDNTSLVNLIAAGVVSVFAIIWLLVNLNVLNESIYSVVFNLPVMVIFGGAVFATKKYSLARTYMIISYSFYLFEYPFELGLF